MCQCVWLNLNCSVFSLLLRTVAHTQAQYAARPLIMKVFFCFIVSLDWVAPSSRWPKSAARVAHTHTHTHIMCSFLVQLLSLKQRRTFCCLPRAICFYFCANTWVVCTHYSLLCSASVTMRCGPKESMLLLLQLLLLPLLLRRRNHKSQHAAA